MANFSVSSLGEGQSINRPPLFSGNNYSYWKNRMKNFVQSNDYAVWRVIINGPNIPMKVVNNVNVPKDENEWNDADILKIQVNAKAMNILHCSLDVNEYNRICCCESAKEIWDRLEITYEGTSQVKEDKISMLVHNYELFKMKTDETISEMFTRFTNIINGLKSLGKTYTDSELVSKILRSLPSAYMTKKLAIKEAIRERPISLDELLGSLITHEMELKELAEDEKPKASKTIAFKSIEEEEDSEEADDDEDGDIALLTRKFKKFLAKKKGHSGKFKKFFSKKAHEGKSSSKFEPRCYNCKELGHIRPNCPKAKEGKNDRKEKRNEKHKKAMKATTWSDSDESSNDEDSSDEEIANLCLMANDDEVSSNFNSDSEYETLNDHDELQNAFDELYYNFDELKTKYINLKKMHSSLSHKYDSLSENLDVMKSENKSIKSEFEKLKIKDSPSHYLISENEKLKLEVKDLTSCLEKFVNGKKNLNMLLGSQRWMYDKAGIGYNENDNEKSFENYSKNMGNSLCTYCGRHTHFSDSCKYRFSTKVAWIPKGTPIFANPYGPNTFWVPKEKLFKCPL